LKFSARKKYLKENFFRNGGGTVQGTLDMAQLKIINVNLASILETTLSRKCR